MRFSAVFATCALFSTGSASTLIARQEIFPDCAQLCFDSAPTGACGDDLGCLCKNENFIATTTLCIEKACTVQDFENAEAVARAQCKSVGVNLTQTFFSQTSVSSSTMASVSASLQASSSFGTGAGITTGTGTFSSRTAGTSSTASQPSPSATAPSSAGSISLSTSIAATSSGSSHTPGIIAGGVVGGLAFVALLFGLGVWFGRRRSRSSSTISADNRTMVSANLHETHQIPVVPLKYYDPSDPSTYPDALTPRPEDVRVGILGAPVSIQYRAGLSVR